MTTLRERTRMAVREEVLVQAWLLFEQHGFEAVTVEQIAEAAGMSRRSFFRYFATKEELVLLRLVAHDARMADCLAARPADEPVWTALRTAMTLLIDSYEVDADRSRALLRMLREPALRGTLSERERRWVARMAPLVAERLPDIGVPGAQDPRAYAVAGAALSCLQAAQLVWAEHPGQELTTLLDRAMDGIAELRA